ncbi:MAG TPA: hypothetical protein VMV25_07830 [Steroidobacteraceae bacterium]|nr:hypothetical protein [Steroidobacteraceae bacterium]
MRIFQILGALLIAGGLYIMIAAPRFASEQSVFKVGDFQAKVQQQKPVPPWIGGIALGAGCVLLVVGFKKT